ncbi:site-specific integrase (plasmid) [Providencia rettgeri]|uniref:tyrosine-type recombinase/integrase n=1 Tax=Providencia rettgeri TaxID=587 RepID=UPI001C21FBA8|nr:site-specific integrase [Providencia rettgeri]
MANLKKIIGKKGGVTYRVTFYDDRVLRQKSYKEFELACYQFYLAESHSLSSVEVAKFFKSYNFTVQKLIYYYLGFQWDKLSRKQLSESTFYRVQSELDSIDSEFLSMQIGNVSEVTIRKYVRPGCFVWLRAAFSLLIEKGLLKYNPCPKPQKRKRKKPSPPSHFEVQKLFDSTDHPQLKMFLFLCAVLGLRTGEALGLRRDDINGDTIHIKRHLTVRGIVEGTKRGEGRDLIVPPEFFVLLSKLNDKSTYIIHGKSINKPVVLQSFRAHKVRPLYAALGLKYSNHALRHFAAANWLAEGRNIKELQELLGHEDEAETLRNYGHLLGKPKALKNTLKIQ